MACARTPHTPVDLQLDVESALPEAAESVRLCVSEGVEGTFAAASGRYALTGLFVQDEHTVTVDVLDGDGRLVARAGPLQVGSYAAVGLTDCPGGDCWSACTGTGERPAADEPAASLGVRFIP